MIAEKSAIDFGPLALAIIVAALLISGVAYFGPANAPAAADSEIRTLSVSADADREVAPDKAEIIFSVVSRGIDPAAVQAENDAKLRQIQLRLSAMGIPASNMKTVGYSLDKWMEYNKTGEKYEEQGYELSNSLRVVTYDVDQAGEVVSEAVQNGANSVQGITFGLSDALRDKTYNELLQTASAQAKSKANAMATSAGVSIVRMHTMSESYGYVEPLANINYRTAGAYDAKSEVSISAGTVKVHASVGATYEISG